LASQDFFISSAVLPGKVFKYSSARSPYFVIALALYASGVAVLPKENPSYRQVVA
jgi:hypothetical protein